MESLTAKGRCVVAGRLATALLQAALLGAALFASGLAAVTEVPTEPAALTSTPVLARVEPQSIVTAKEGWRLGAGIARADARAADHRPGAPARKAPGAQGRRSSRIHQARPLSRRRYLKQPVPQVAGRASQPIPVQLGGLTRRGIYEAAIDISWTEAGKEQTYPLQFEVRRPVPDFNIALRGAGATAAGLEIKRPLRLSSRHGAGGVGYGCGSSRISTGSSTPRIRLAPRSAGCIEQSRLHDEIPDRIG